MIATISFDRCDETADWNQLDTFGMQEMVMTALDRCFGGYGWAAEAQRDYRRVVAGIEADAPNLFGAAEAMRAGLEARPEALKWSAFEGEAAAAIAPFRFTIRFTE